MAHGRGAWPVSGAGGTLSFDGDGPGPYYREGVLVPLGWDDPSVDRRAVHGAVVAIQRGLNRRDLGGGNLRPDGFYGPRTARAMRRFQASAGIQQWGGAGDETCRRLFMPDLRSWCDADEFEPWRVVAGVIYHESLWDPGAVGYLDPRDVGLAQINGDAHPTMSERDRLLPSVAVRFVVGYLRDAIGQLGNLTDAVASYNLGIGGARAWVRAGRPQWWTPAGADRPRDVLAYVDSILNAPV